MVSCKAFNDIHNWIYIDGKKLSVIVSERKPVCWHCGETGHCSAVCPCKKTSERAAVVQEWDLFLSKETVKKATY